MVSLQAFIVVPTPVGATASLVPCNPPRIQGRIEDGRLTQIR
jgi:hypothetical protein